MIDIMTVALMVVVIVVVGVVVLVMAIEAILVLLGSGGCARGFEQIQLSHDTCQELHQLAEPVQPTKYNQQVIISIVKTY